MRRERVRNFAHALAAAASVQGLVHAGAALAQAAEYPADSIVVTATREAQPLRRVPISASAYDSATLEIKGAKTISDIARFTPGVTFTPGTDAVVIRGVGSGAGASTTGIYIDEVPIQMRSLGFESNNTLPGIFDLERVEIIRGPQGTVIGAGSEGGSIRYITPQPSLTRYSGKAHAELSSIAHGGWNYETGVALGGPILKDVLGFRISGWHRRDGGYVDRVDNQDLTPIERNANWMRTTALRGSLAWAPAPGLTITPSMQYQRRFQNDTDMFWFSISDPKRGVFRNGGPDVLANPDEFYLPSLTVDYRFAGLRAVSVTSLYRRNDVSRYDGTIYNLSYLQQLITEDSPLYPLLTPTGPSPAVAFYRSPSRVANKQRNFTQELRLQTDDPSARLRWTIGAFYQRARQQSIENLSDPMANDLYLPLFGSPIEQFFSEDGTPIALYNGVDSYTSQVTNTDTELAGFVNARYKLLPSVTIEGGVRYARSNIDFFSFADGPQNGGRTETRGSGTEYPLTPRFSIDWQPDDRNLFYASWSRGYRAGGVNPVVPAQVCRDSLDAMGLENAPDSYKSDTVTSIEVGAKNSLFDRALMVSASAYQLRWKDIQESVLLPDCSIQYTDNLGTARVRGFDLQASIRPVQGVLIDATLSYTKANYLRAAPAGPDPDGPIVANAGNTLGGAPWTFAVGGQYSFATGGRSAFVRADYQYSSFNRGLLSVQDPASSIYDPGAVQPSATHYVSARAGVTLSRIDVALFANNLFDSTPRLLRTHMDAQTLLYTQRTWTPRTIGLSVSRRF